MHGSEIIGTQTEIYVNMGIENRIYCSKHRFIGVTKNLGLIKGKTD